MRCYTGVYAINASSPTLKPDSGYVMISNHSRDTPLFVLIICQFTLWRWSSITCHSVFSYISQSADGKNQIGGNRRKRRVRCDVKFTGYNHATRFWSCLSSWMWGSWYYRGSYWFFSVENIVFSGDRITDYPNWAYIRGKNTIVFVLEDRFSSQCEPKVIGSISTNDSRLMIIHVGFAGNRLV